MILFVVVSGIKHYQTTDINKEEKLSNHLSGDFIKP